MEDGGVLLAICGGYQISVTSGCWATRWCRELRGIVDMTTERAAGGSGDRPSTTSC
ncbi:MAG: hypothetical protein ACLT98_04395 [Eggerthellaceae bacterium]